MKMTEVWVFNAHDNVSKAVSYAGPVRFHCNGGPNTLMVEHSIWEPHYVFKYGLPFGGRLEILAK